MKPLGCAPYPQTRRHPRTAGGADAPHLCTSKRYDFKADELLLGTDAVDVVVKATVTRAGQIAAATENSIAEPAPSTAETSAGSSRFPPVVRVTSSRGRAAEQRDERAPSHVWMAPAWQEIIWRAAQRSLAVMCPACWCSPGGLLALMGSANRVRS